MPYVFTAAAHTVAVVDVAARAAFPMMMPAALAPGVARATAQPAIGPAAMAVPHTRSVAMSDRGRLEYERERGGALGERALGRHQTIVALWHAVAHRRPLR